MRFGVCAGIDDAEAATAAGFDYIELPVNACLVPESSDTEWAVLRRRIGDMRLPAEAFNLFIQQKIVGPQVDLDRVKRWVTTSIARASEVGASVIVFGSGGARNVPEGFDFEQASTQIEWFLNACAVVCESTDVRIAVEPLNRGETNTIHTVAEAAELAHRVRSAHVGALADSYHMEVEHEPIEAIFLAKEVLVHVHTADTRRVAPGKGLYDHAALFRALSAAGYDDRMSIECSFGDMSVEELASALNHLRSAERIAAGAD